MKYIPILCIIFASFILQTFAQTPPATTAVPDSKEIAKTQKAVDPGPMEMTKNPAGEAIRSFAKKDTPARIPRFETAPAIDGQLNDEIWRGAAMFGDFVQTQPGDNTAPSHPTEVMMGYDSKNLYVAFRVKQDRDKVRATVSRRDNIFDDDYIGLYLDTFNDQRQAYTVFFNPLGIQADGTMTEGRGEDYSIDIVMESKGVLTPDGFTIEVAIPFKSLRYEAGKDKQWGIQIYRRIKYANAELNSWMPRDRGKSGSLNQAGHITGLEGIETTRQLEINPSFTLSESGRRTRYTFNNDPSGRYVNDGIKGEFGVTAKFSLTPTTTLDFAYNPDFAQVEADAPVTTANQRFPIFFDEKRPFFLERIDIFNSGLDLVNTRAIVDPDIAAKLTGRQGKNTFGILYASDNAPGNYNKDERQDLLECRLRQQHDPNVVCGTERFMDKNAGIGVLRYKRDIGKENSLGLFATSYNFVDKHNYTSGVDGRYRFSKKIVAEFDLVGTHSRRNFYDPNLDRVLYRTGNGLGYRFWIERADRNLYMNYMAEGRSNNYRADVGFTQRTDTNYLGSFIRYETDKDPKKAIISKQIWNETNIRYDWKGRTQYSITNTRGQIALQRQTYIGVNFQLGYERVLEHEFGPRRSATQLGAFSGNDPGRSANLTAGQFFIETTPTKQLYFFFFTDYTSGQMEYDFGAGPGFPRVSRAALLGGQNAPLDPGPGNQLMIESTIRYQPTSAFKTQLNYNKIWLRRHDTGLVAFDDNIFSSRSTYQFNRNTFARLRVDYSTLNKHIRPQFVVGWTPSPGTALYMGYNDDISYNGWNPYVRNPPQGPLLEPGFHGNGRSFFIKMSYLFKKSF